MHIKEWELHTRVKENSIEMQEYQWSKCINYVVKYKGTIPIKQGSWNQGHFNLR